MRSIWVCLAYVVLTSTVCATNASATEIPKIHFAGFALVGKADESHTLFPYSKQLIEPAQNGAPSELQKMTREKLRSRSFSNVEITNESGDIDNGDALSLAFVLTWENVSVERYEDFNKISVNLQAEALLFDFKTKRILAAYPVGAEYIDSVQGPVSEERKRQDVRYLYQDSANGLISELVSVIARIRPTSDFGNRIQISQVDISPDANAALLQYNITTPLAKGLLTNSFERYLSSNGNVPVLPHTNDQVIGRVMTANFMNGDVYNLDIPPSDYNIHLTLTNVRRIIVSRTAATTAYAYAAYVDVKVDQPLSETQYIDASVKFPIVKVLANTGTPDDSEGIQEVLLSIADQITKQWRQPSSDWSKQWLVRQSSPNQFAKMPSILDRCR